MNIENPLAYSFFLTDDVYLTGPDRQVLKGVERPAETPQPIAETPKPLFQYRGGNKKHYLVISHYPNHDFMADTHLTALEATLKRLDIDPDSIAIFNYAKYAGTELQEIIAFFKPQKILMLGNHALPEGMGAAHQNKPRAVTGIRALLTFSFDEMMDNTENKKTFWEAMKLF